MKIGIRSFTALGLVAVFTALLLFSTDSVTAKNPPVTPGMLDYSRYVGVPESPDRLAAVLWNQPVSTVNLASVANQDFESAHDEYDVFLADDFHNDDLWEIISIYIPGNTWNVGGSLTCANTLNWEIYPDAGGKPGGDPWGGGGTPIWSLTLPLNDSQIYLSNGTGGWPSNVTLTLSQHIYLIPGTWWLVFYPQMDVETCFQYGRHVSDTTNASVAVVINPGGGMSLPTEWTSIQDATAYNLDQYDLAFRLEGVAISGSTTTPTPTNTTTLTSPVDTNTPTPTGTRTLTPNAIFHFAWVPFVSNHFPNIIPTVSTATPSATPTQTNTPTLTSTPGTITPPGDVTPGQYAGTSPDITFTVTDDFKVCDLDITVDFGLDECRIRPPDCADINAGSFEFSMAELSALYTISGSFDTSSHALGDYRVGICGGSTVIPVPTGDWTADKQ